MLKIVAAFLSFLIPGLGHLLLFRISEAIAWFVVAVVGGCLGVPPIFIGAFAAFHILADKK
tara:strand:+ start:395 stop:577 length:183 start_codon:yes stop_codon:yes gene_type:complete